MSVRVSSNSVVSQVSSSASPPPLRSATSAKSAASEMTQYLIPFSPDTRARVLMVTHYIPFHVTLAPATFHAGSTSPFPNRHHRTTSVSTAGVGSSAYPVNGGSAGANGGTLLRRSFPDVRAFEPTGHSGSVVGDSPDRKHGMKANNAHPATPKNNNALPEAKLRLLSSTPVQNHFHDNSTPSPPPRSTHHLETPKLASSAGPLMWHFTPRRDHSALYAGIFSAQKHADCVYIGCIDHYYTEDGTCMEAFSLSEEMKADLKKALWEEKRCVPVFNEPQVSAAHYDGFCKQGLWQLCHYILWEPTEGRNEARYWAAYIKTNQLLADAIAEIYELNDAIWIHDYHFFLLPSMARKLLPHATIGFFLHTPFPSSELFRCLPQRKEILKGLLGANLVGFQTYAYARHFISSCTRVLGVESTPKGVEYRGFHVAVGTFPIGIDVEQVQKARKSENVEMKIQAIREMYADKKIIIGRDKLDQIKGVKHKLNAFEKFLNEYPEWQDKVVLIQVTSPTEHSSSKLETKVSELVARINGQYGSLGFAPVHHYHHHIDQEEYYALLTLADVALITSVRDGMNTTSHEYVVCQQENHGPLILSEFTGTAGSLSAAFLVNPWDTRGVAAAIHEGLTMSKEDKLIKHTQLFNYVTMNTADFWATSFIKELQFVARIPDHANPTAVLDVNKVVDQFKAAKKRIFFLDYDGTLTPIRKTPNAAVPPKEMLRALERLANDPSIYIYVISGRDQAALDLWLGHIEHIGLSAEHGSFIKYPTNPEWINLAEEMDLSWKNDVLPVFEYYTERTPGSFIEQKQSSLTWHYRLADPEFGSWQAKECHNHLENAVLSKLPVEILLGKKNLEVRPQQVNKGEIVKRLLSQTKDCDFIFCAGDDKTDEDMFKALRKSDIDEDTFFTCTIGSATKKTQASWHLTRPEELIQVLEKLADAMESK